MPLSIPAMHHSSSVSGESSCIQQNQHRKPHCSLIHCLKLAENLYIVTELKFAGFNGLSDAIFWLASPWKHALGEYGI